MLKKIIIVSVLAVFASCTARQAFDPASVADADAVQVSHVEPLSWWTGMNTPLQLMVHGQGVSEYVLSVEGGDGVSVSAVHEADSPNYLFADIKISAKARPGTYYLVFTRDGESAPAFKYPYEIEARRSGSAERKSFTTADMVYLIMPDRFANGDTSNDSVDCMTEKADRSEPFGRHGGDIQGIIDHLDYISGLGATYIWATPFLADNAPEGSYHGYAASDYYHIDPRFGSNSLYREFVAKAKEKGMGVIMDMVPNHCGTEHWWMDDLPFEDWIHQFPEYTGTNVCFSANMDPNASAKDLYLNESGWFVPSMVDMNLDNPYMLRYFVQWAVWWIEYAGLEGLRVDTYPYNEKQPAADWCAAIRSEYPDMNIVGECWTSSVPQLAYWQGGNPNKDGFDSNLPSIMDFPLYDAVCAGLTCDNPGWGQGMTRIYDALSHDFVYHDLSKMLIFPGNHDTARIGDVVRKDPSRLKIAMALMATMRGIPQIFAGDELMFVSSNSDDMSNHGGLRVDFPGGWPGDAVDLFTEEGRDAQTVNTDGLAVAKGQAGELYRYVSRLFNWRKGKKVIHDGRTMHFLSRDNTYGYFRYDDSDAVFVYVNNSDEAKNIPWSHYSEISDGLSDGRDVITGEAVEVSDSTVAGPRSVLVVEFRRN
ncbi:MAG: glycoside hydrolase family 13 protein [Bacteroidales bacterium]|nr:glycoside hydrolase family 13 protein [Bacteroidales bacterium]